MLWKRLVKSANWEGGFQQSIRDKQCPAQDFPSPHQALCLAAYTQACVDYFVRPLTGKADAHPCLASLQRGGLLSTPLPVSMVTKGEEDG